MAWWRNTFDVIEIWRRYKNLYDTKNHDYHNKDKRQKSLLAIERYLNENGITANMKHISKKLKYLKSFFGKEKQRLMEACGSGNAVGDVIGVSNWKFYNHLEFLKNASNPHEVVIVE